MFSSQAFADATNHLAGYTSASAINQFQTVEVNGNIGIGTATPSSSLSISSVYPASIGVNSFTGPGDDTNTILLLPLNNNVTDLSPNALTVTNNNVTFSNSSPKFAGMYYGVFNGTNAYLTAPNESYFNFGSGDFTVDFWVNFVNLPSSGSYFNDYVLFDKWDSGVINGYYLYVTNNSGTYQIRATGENSNVGVGNSGSITITPVIGTWYHIAWVRSGSNWSIYLNGTSISSVTDSGSIGTNTGPFAIGASDEDGPLDRYSNVDIEEFRVSNIARWTSNFTPPTAPYATVPLAQMVFQDTSVQKAKLWMDGNDSDKFKIDDATATRLTIAGGNVGIGTINPAALLDVTGPVRIQTGLITNGTAPTIGTGSGDCGTSPSVVGNDISGTVTVGSGTNGGQCTVNFSAAKSSTPNCICQNSTTANLTRAASQSTTSFACTGTLTAGDKLVYWCPQ